MALTERQLEEVSWEKPGTCVSGRLLSVTKVKYSDNIGTKYLVKRVDGKVVSFRGTTQIDLLIHRGDQGKLIEVTFVGNDAKDVKPGMSAKKIFRILVDDQSAPDYQDSPITDEDLPF